MKEVEVTYKSTAEFFDAAIDMRRLTFVNGVSTWGVRGGARHALQWFVRGAPGSSYTIRITRPKEATFEHSATLDLDMKDAGLHWFSITPEADE